MDIDLLDDDEQPKKRLNIILIGIAVIFGLHYLYVFPGFESLLSFFNLPFILTADYLALQILFPVALIAFINLLNIGWIGMTAYLLILFFNGAIGLFEEVPPNTQVDLWYFLQFCSALFYLSAVLYLRKKEVTTLFNISKKQRNLTYIISTMAILIFRFAQYYAYSL